MIDFSVTFNLVAFCIVAGLALIMLVSSVVMLFCLHKSRVNFFGVLTYALTWIIMIASLVVTTVALINRFAIMDVSDLVGRLGEFVKQLADLTFNALMMEIAFYALTVLSIVQLIIHPFVWTTKKEYATPVQPADGDGYITVDEAFDHFDEAARAEEVIPTETIPTDDIYDEPEVADIPTEQPEEVEQPTEETVEDQPAEEVEQPVEEIIEQEQPNEEVVDETVEEPVEETAPVQSTEDILSNINETNFVPADEPIAQTPAQHEEVVEEVEQPIEEVVETPAQKEEVVETPTQPEEVVETPTQTEEVVETPTQPEPPVQSEVKVEEPKIEVKTITRPSRKGSRIVASKSSETGRRKAGKVSDGASAAFAEYLKQQSQEDQKQIKESIDRVVIDTRNGKK